MLLAGRPGVTSASTDVSIENVTLTPRVRGLARVCNGNGTLTVGCTDEAEPVRARGDVRRGRIEEHRKAVALAARAAGRIGRGRGERREAGGERRAGDLAGRGRQREAGRQRARRDAPRDGRERARREQRLAVRHADLRERQRRRRHRDRRAGDRERVRARAGHAVRVHGADGERERARDGGDARQQAGAVERQARGQRAPESTEKCTARRRPKR